MSVKGLVHEFPELLRIVFQDLSAFFKCDAGGRVTAFIHNVAGGLIGDEFNVNVFSIEIFQQVNNVAVIRD